MPQEFRIPQLGSSKANLSPIYSFMNDAAAFHERSQLEQSLNAWNYDDGFIDTHYNNNAVSSTTNVDVVTGSDGRVVLGRSAGTEYFSYGSTYSVSGTPYQTMETYTSPTNFDGAVYSLELDISASDGGVGDIRVTFNYVDGSSAQIEKLDVNTVTQVFESPDKSTEVDSIEVEGKNEAGSSQNVGFNGARAYDVSYYNGTGSITYNTKTYDFVPSKIVPNLEYTLNSQDITMIVEDGNGNSVTIQENQFDTEIDVSFSSTDMFVKIQLTGDGTGTPEIDTTELLTVL